MTDFKPVTKEEAYDLLYGKYEMESDSDPMIRPYSEEHGWVVQMGEGSYTNALPDAPYEDAKLLAHAERALRTIAEETWEYGVQGRELDPIDGWLPWTPTIPFHKGGTHRSCQRFIEGRSWHNFEYRIVRRRVSRSEVVE